MNTNIDKKYALILSSQFEGYKILKTNPLNINFRCIICGDSPTNKNKKRGYILEDDKSGSIRYYCHNCSYNKNIKYFLKENYPEIYKKYMFDIMSFKNDNKTSFTQNTEQEIKIPEKEKIFQPIKKLYSLSEIKKLKPDHKSIKYVSDRKIPFNLYQKIYWCPKFFKWINMIIPEKFSPEALKYDHGRIVLTIIDEKGYTVGIIGRTIENQSPKYLTILFYENTSKVYGLNKVDFTKKIYITEGPIDSMFIKNSIAMAGSDINLDNIPKLKNKKTVIIFDNQPRNKEIVKKYDKYITNGFSVCIFPNNIIGKDINDLIISGYSRSDIKKLIDDNTYSGLQAKNKLSNWKKI